jgi:O-antigen/teichoic acid export membrane protein
MAKKSRKNKVSKNNKNKSVEIIEGVLILILTFLVLYFAAYFQPLISAGISFVFLIILLIYLYVRYKMKKKKRGKNG